jgi:hypothetical protein
MAHRLWARAQFRLPDPERLSRVIGADGEGRIDNPYGDRNLICTCQPIEDYEGGCGW